MKKMLKNFNPWIPLSNIVFKHVSTLQKSPNWSRFFGEPTISNASTTHNTNLATKRLRQNLSLDLRGLGRVYPLKLCFNTVDGRNTANQLRLVVYPIINKVLYIPG